MYEIFVVLYGRNCKWTFLVSVNKIVRWSCSVSSVGIPCVSDFIFRFNIFLIDNILSLSQRVLSEYRWCLKRNVMERLICQISVLKGTLTQIWNSANIFVFMWKESVEDFKLKRLLVLGICSREIYEKFVYKHSEK